MDKMHPVLLGEKEFYSHLFAISVSDVENVSQFNAIEQGSILAKIVIKTSLWKNQQVVFRKMRLIINIFHIHMQMLEVFAN